MSEQRTYSNGGPIPGAVQTVTIHPDECLLNHAAQCQRGDHPTPTSDCTTQRWIGRRP